MKLTHEQARKALLKTYTERCYRIANEQVRDNKLFQAYANNISAATSCMTFEDLLRTIQTDGDFDDDPEGLVELLQQSFIEESV